MRAPIPSTLAPWRRRAWQSRAAHLQTQHPPAPLAQCPLVWSVCPTRPGRTLLVVSL
ncbi:hypothetical protein BOTBODRAFT_32937, partial [Botryobasidium botryosum FD-172 SS1]